MYKHSQKHLGYSKTLSGILILLTLFTTGPLPIIAFASGPNLVSNPSLETPSSGGTDPEGWLRGGYGTNDGVLSYPVLGNNSAQAAAVTITSYTDGDVKWFFTPIAVVAGKQYTFTDEYLSSSITQLTAEYFDANHIHLSYGGFFQVPANTATGVWGVANVTFAVPAGAAFMTVFHSLQSIGSLTIDNVSLSEVVAPHATLNTIVTVSGGTSTPDQFPVTITGANAVPNSFSGSISGTQSLLDAGASYSVAAGSVPHYKTMRSAECTGTLADGATGTCTLTETLLTGSTTLLNVVTNVVNTHGGTNPPSNFIINVNGANASPSSFAGSALGQAVSVTPGANYTVAVNPGIKYTVAFSPDCSGALVEGDTVTCAVTLTDIAQIVDGSNPPNLIPNPTLELIDPTNPSLPAKWSKGTAWGTNVAIYEYPFSFATTSAAADSDISIGKAVRVSYAAYTGDTTAGGDAKWYFTPVPVSPGHRYVYQDSYIANTPTYIVAEYFNAAGIHLVNDGFVLIPSTPESVWKIAGTSFTAPTGAAYMTVYHVLNSTGALTLDSFKLNEAPLPTPFAQGFVSLTFDDGFLDHFQTAKTILDNGAMKGTFYIVSHNSGFGIKNPSLETADPADPSKPLGWLTSGSDNATFSYPVPGHTGVGARVSSTQNGSSAAWYYSPVSVFADENNEFSHYYKSTGNTEVFIQITNASGTFQYANSDGDLDDSKVAYATLPPAADWTQFKSIGIWLPPGVKNVRVLHSLADAGTLDIDDANMGAYVDYMTPAQVLGLQTDGQEIGGHTQTHADLLAAGLDQAGVEVNGSRQDLLAGGVTPLLSFAYPYGNSNSDIQHLTQAAGYSSARGTFEGYNGKNTNRYDLLTKSVNADTKLSDIQSWINQAVADHTWLILTFHQIEPLATTGGTLAYATTPDMLTGIVSYLKTNNIPVHTVREGVSQMNSPTLNVVTTVTNTHGGTKSASDFLISITGASASPGSFTGSEGGTTATIEANVPYAVTVAPLLPNYVSTLSAGCTGTIAPDGVAHCTVSLSDITVVLDTTPPVIASHGTVEATATSSAGAVVAYALPAASDDHDATIAVACAPLSGALFPIGLTTVSCGAKDLSGNAATTTTFTIHVTLGGASGTTGTTTASSSDLHISGLSTLNNGFNSMIVKWMTDLPATSQLVYDIISHNSSADLSLPNFGYASATPLDSTRVTVHATTINDLLSGTVYYFRPVSDSKAGDEISTSTPPAVSTSTPPTPTPAPIPTPTPVPTPAPITGGGTSGGGGSAIFTHYGCMNPLARNYDRLANTDDRSCIGVATTTVTATSSSSTIGTGSIATSTPPVSVTTPPATATTSVSRATGQVLGASSTTITRHFMRKLRLKSRGNDVSELQKRLSELGFYFGPVTGYFGKLTAAAVSVFQAAHGLDSVGYVGPLTLATLNENPVSGTLAITR